MMYPHYTQAIGQVPMTPGYYPLGENGDPTIPGAPLPDAPPPPPDAPPGTPAPNGQMTAPADPMIENLMTWRKRAYFIIRPAAVLSGLYHGYKRTESVGWSLAWGAFGFVLPVTSALFSVVQKPGYSKRKTGR